MPASEAKQTEDVKKVHTLELSEVFSASFPVDLKLSRGRWARVNLTVKHGLNKERAKEDFDNLYQFLDTLANDGDYVFFVGDLRSPFPPAVTVNGDEVVKQTAGNPTEPTYEPVEGVTPNGNGHAKGNTFSCGDLTVKFMGKTGEPKKAYYEVSGSDPNKFPKFPIRVWPEVMTAAGIEEEEVDPRDGYSLIGWTATYEKNEQNKPTKVIELRKPDFAS